MIKMIMNYFSQEQKDKRKKLREIGIKIAEASDYNELVRLVNEYNRLKDEN
jgi:hypothetical protein